MPYHSRRAGPLTGEERDAKAALVGCGCMTEGATCHDWTPAAVIYQRYRTWHAEHCWQYDPDHPLLTRRQFGRAMRRVFPAVQRRKRAAGRRKRQWGYAFLACDFGIVTPPPRKRRMATLSTITA
jgi:hypothetical protein